jgi:carboxylesterase
VHELKKLFRQATRALPHIQAPALVFKSSMDGVVPPSSVAMITRHMDSSRLKVVTLPASGHVATLDVDAPIIFEESARFFRQDATDRVASESS